jgi:hypothetical protein
MPASDVTLLVADALGPYQVRGYFDNLTLAMDKSLRAKRVLPRSGGDEAVNISSVVRVQGKNLYVPGDVIRRIGLHNATPGDTSAPGW